MPISPKTQYFRDLLMLTYFLAVLLHPCLAGSCDKAAIRQCLSRSVSFLQDTTLGQAHKSLFLTTLEHYMVTLQDAHEDIIHISSLNTILTNIDVAVLRPARLQEACGVFAATEKCLKDMKTWCDGEVRDQLEGMEEMFNFMCLEDKIKIYKANYNCLTMNNTLNEIRKGCSERLELGLHQVGRPFPSISSSPKDTTVSTGDIGDNQDAILFTTGIHIPKGQASEDSIKHTSRSVCRLVDIALNCYHEAVKMKCQSEAADWSVQLRHTLVHYLLVDLQCEDYDPSFRYRDIYQEPVCFQCVSNQSECIDLSLKCNDEPDCEDGSDEDEQLCDPGSRVNLAGILIGLSVVVLLVIVIVVCIVKKRQSADFDSKLAKDKDTEMLSIANEEVVLGESTPPAPPGGRKFIYQAIGNSNAAKA